MLRLVARAAVSSTLRRRPRRPYYRYTLTSLESMFSVIDGSDENDRKRERLVARRIFGYGFLVLVMTMVGIAIVLKQLVHVAVVLLA